MAFVRGYRGGLVVAVSDMTRAVAGLRFFFKA
jgi:hypothetical protein